MINQRVAIALIILIGSPLIAQQRLPIIDMHLHAAAATDQGPPPVAMCTPIETFPAWDPNTSYGETFMQLLKNPPCNDPVWSPMTDDELMNRTMDVMEKLNIVGVVSGTAQRVSTWQKAAPDRMIPGLIFNLATPGTPSPDDLRTMVENGDLKVLGEVVNQYAGIEPGDERMEPYWALAEELDLPVGIHVGTGPPGAIYLGAQGYRARLHSALTMEEVLVKHPRLRVYLMHAGYPMLEDLLTLLYAHPQVYVDVGVIVYTQPRAAFYKFLQGIMDSGFGKRVMFGSDQMVWPEAIERAVTVIEEAPFLSPEEKRDILYNNAARFLRLSEEEIEKHHGM